LTAKNKSPERQQQNMINESPHYRSVLLFLFKFSVFLFLFCNQIKGDFPMINFKRMKNIFSMMLLLFFTSFIGCSNGNVKFGGKVTFEDGSPLTTGVVIFDNGVTMSSAPIRPDGTFTAGTSRENNGIPPGTYRVSIGGAIELLDNPENKFPAPSRPLIHSKLTNPETSGLTVTIDQSPQPYNIVVQPPE
jgi:hypothetical protein